ncbi:MAG: GrlR family regulatory protein [Ewingella sp.]|uniref:GrlR family regulatory protein n=1 Tax=Ewingella sp. TaxID=1897459 RepID=UPI003F8FA2BE
MKDGIYFVIFHSNHQDVGSGTVVVKNGSVNGGDFGFTYRGKVQGQSLDLSVTQHDAKAVNVFPGLNNFTMNLVIAELDGGYNLKGEVNGVPQAQLSVRAKFIGDLI